MMTYETLYIVRPDLDDDAVHKVVHQVETLVKDNGGTIVHAEIWGKRRLAYKVRRFTEGCYVLLRFEAPAGLIPRLQTHFRISESILRYLVVRFDQKTLRREAEQSRRKEDQTRASAIGGVARAEAGPTAAPAYARGEDGAKE